MEHQTEYKKKTARLKYGTQSPWEPFPVSPVIPREQAFREVKRV